MTALTFGPRIQHYGGPCPVLGDYMVRVWGHNILGNIERSEGRADSFDWRRIIAYAVAQPAAPAVEAWSPYNNRVRTDLLEPHELAAMQAHDGPWELHETGRKWTRLSDQPKWFSDYIYRAVPPPETREVVMHLGFHRNGWTAQRADWTDATHTFTLTLDAAGRPVSVGDLREKDTP